jgi:hypothetical protein
MNLIKSNIFWWMVSICGAHVKSLLPRVKPRKRFEGTLRIDKLFLNEIVSAGWMRGVRPYGKCRLVIMSGLMRGQHER